MHFASDNTAGAHPDILAALAAANAEPVAAYGDDAYTARLTARLRAVFDHEGLVAFPLATGSAGNALALATLCPPWGAAYCHPLAHINVDECAAPEVANPGMKVIAVDGLDAKLTPANLEALIRGKGFVHAAQPSVVSLTNLTELGTAYTRSELTALGAFCRDQGLKLHMDGARFANALVASKHSAADLTWRAGVDALTFGATKNGCLAAEAVIFFDPSLGEEFAFRRKRAGHLFSKMRLLSTQLLGYLDGGLWLRLAAHANAMADRLARGLTAAGYAPLFPPEGNMIFARLPLPLQEKLKDSGAVFYPGRLPFSDGTDVRLVTAWSTREAEVDRFVEALERVAFDWVQ